MTGSVFALIEEAYQRAPALVLALSALVILPAVALISLAAQAVRRFRNRRSALRAALRVAAEAAVGSDAAEAAELSTRHQAWLTVEGQPGSAVPLSGPLIRIGGDEDNDVRLADDSVRPYHAVIERTPEEEFVITDVSGEDGGGVSINGERAARALLAHGDVIALGQARLRFENAPA